ncbi:MAG TPA: hypothetical protein VFO82_12000 [Steroidobacteraceae bacterium]|nr:hypothetical protein [Steroidobacteraceae bacterium]
MQELCLTAARDVDHMSDGIPTVNGDIPRFLAKGDRLDAWIGHCVDDDMSSEAAGRRNAAATFG